MRSIGSVMGEMQGEAKDRASLTEQQQETLQAFLDAVEAWTQGEMTLDAALAYTGDGWLRSRAAHQVKPGHKEHKDVMAFFDAVIQRQVERGAGVHVEGQGYFSRAEIESAGGRMVRMVDEDGVPHWSAEYPRVVERQGRHDIIKPVAVSAFKMDW